MYDCGRKDIRAQYLRGGIHSPDVAGVAERISALNARGARFTTPQGWIYGAESPDYISNVEKSTLLEIKSASTSGTPSGEMYSAYRYTGEHWVGFTLQEGIRKRENREIMRHIHSSRMIDCCVGASPHWGGCPRVDKRTKLHVAIRVDGLHFAILSQLAPRVGHVPRPRIPHGRFGGYIQSLREQIDAKPVRLPNWRAPRCEVKDSAVMTEWGGRFLNSAIGQAPTDFAETDLTELGLEMGEVLYASDNWAYGYGPNGPVNWDRVRHLSDELKVAQDWRGGQSPPSRKNLGVRVLNDLKGRGDAPYMQGVLETIDRVTESGSSRDKKLAEEARAGTQSHAAGRCLSSEVQRGEKSACGSFGWPTCGAWRLAVSAHRLWRSLSTECGFATLTRMIGEKRRIPSRYITPYRIPRVDKQRRGKMMPTRSSIFFTQ